MFPDWFASILFPFYLIFPDPARECRRQTEADISVLLLNHQKWIIQRGVFYFVGTLPLQSWRFNRIFHEAGSLWYLDPGNITISIQTTWSSNSQKLCGLVGRLNSILYSAKRTFKFPSVANYLNWGKFRFVVLYKCCKLFKLGNSDS